MSHLSGHIAPGVLTFVACQLVGTLLKLYAHLVILLHQGSNLVTTTEIDWLVMSVKSDFSHLFLNDFQWLKGLSGYHQHYYRRNAKQDNDDIDIIKREIGEIVIIFRP